MIAFWKYDLYPYCLSGRVCSTRPDGWVEVTGFGPGRFFRPFLLMEDGPGEERQARLEQLKSELHKAKTGLYDDYNAKLRDVCPEALGPFEYHS